jgi:hypothetical protein
MFLERIDLSTIKITKDIEILESLRIGDSIFCEDLKKAHSLRSLSYYLVRSRNLKWKFTFRKIDYGWRIIRVE